MAIFNLLASNIENLELKLEGKLPVDRDELLALVNSWGRESRVICGINNEIEIKPCRAKECYDLSKLDVNQIKNFDSIFYSSYFDGDINSWDVSNATSMVYMFKETINFNYPLNSWDVSNVTSMRSMFYSAKEFNSPLDKWNTSKVINMHNMFAFAKNFNQNINSWNVSQVINMDGMFFYTKAFNSPLDKWNVSNVTNINNMFSCTKEFNQPLDNWNISNVTSMHETFYKTEKFNQNLNSWDITKVTSINSMFQSAKAFNQAILWDISKIEKCFSIFLYSEAFENKFNKKNKLPKDTNEIKEWLKKNKTLMEAINAEENKANVLDNFLLNLNVIVSKKLNGLHNNNGIYNGKI